MFSRVTAKKWLSAAVIPAVFGLYYAFALPGHAPAIAAPQTQADTHSAARAAQRLPDFTRIVEENGPSVVNVSVSRSAPKVAQGEQPGMPDLAPDDPL